MHNYFAWRFWTSFHSIRRQILIPKTFFNKEEVLFVATLRSLTCTCKHTQVNRCGHVRKTFVLWPWVMLFPQIFTTCNVIYMRRMTYSFTVNCTDNEFHWYTAVCTLVCSTMAMNVHTQINSIIESHTATLRQYFISLHYWSL